MPADGAVVEPQTTLEITFSEPVAAKEGWLTVTCSAVRAPVATSGGAAQFRASPETGSWPAREACTVVIHAAAITDLDGYLDPLAEDFAWQFNTGGFSFAACGAPATLIQDLPLPGEGATGTQVTVEAVVTGAFQGRRRWVASLCRRSQARRRLIPRAGRDSSCRMQPCAASAGWADSAPAGHGRAAARFGAPDGRYPGCGLLIDTRCPADNRAYCR